ncbi:hypothetical protein EC957_006942 [Mortierella hygrophila]|uniref:GH16 domain-containing protein n=1 Tax=Mortierella hygrophila TaxID=979708 RepID=A0A9P6EYN9_9FUNG|nr:hypothetical protein EC957_006942 [Mortierella hygrophila]
MGKKGANKKLTNATTNNNGTHSNNNNNSNPRSKKVKLMVKNPFTDMVTHDSTKEQQHDNSTTIVATAPLTASEFAASQQQQQRPDFFNPFSDIHANLFDRQSGEENDEGDEDEDEDEESVVRARRETLAALDPYNANAHKEHFKSLKVPKQQQDILEQTVPSSPAESSTQTKDFEEPEGSMVMIAASTPPTSRRQHQHQQQRDSSSIYSTPKAQIQHCPLSLSRAANNSSYKDIVPEISISLATPSPPPSSTCKRHHRRGSSLVNSNPALLTTTFTPSPLSSISPPLNEEFDRQEANKKDKTNRSTAIYTNFFQRISSFGPLGGKAIVGEEEVVNHIGAEIKKDPAAPASKPVSTSWSLKRNTFGTSSGTRISSSLSDPSIQQQSSQVSRFSIMGKKSNKGGARGSKKSRKHGVTAMMDSLDPWDSCDDMLLQGTDDEDDGSCLSATHGDQFLKGRMGGRRRSSDDATTRVETEQGVIPRLGKGAMAGMDDWMMHPRTAAIRGNGSFHKVRHDDTVPVPVPVPVSASVRPVSSSAIDFMTISLASPPMTVYSTQAIGGGGDGATSLNKDSSFDSSLHRLKKGASSFLGSLGSSSLQNNVKGQAKMSQDQDEDERMRRMMNGDHYDGDGGRDLVFDSPGGNDGDDIDFAFNQGRVDQRSSSMTFGPTFKEVSSPPLATFSSLPSLRDFIHSATGLSRSSTVPVGNGSGMGNISPPPFSPTAYLRRSQTTAGGFGGYSEVQRGYTSSSNAAATGTDGGRASFSPVSRRRNTPVMVPTIVVPKHVPGSGASVALSATPVSFSPPPLTSLSNSSSSTTTTVMTSSDDDDDSSDYLSMTMSRTTPPTRTFHRLGPSSSTPSSITVPAKAATAANSTQLPSSLAAAAMAAAQRARAVYNQALTSTSSNTSTLNRSNTSISVDSMTGPLTGNDYIGQFERERAQARSFGDDDGQGPFGSMHKINHSSLFNSNNSSSMNSLATTVHQQQFQHGSTVYHPTAMSSTTTLLVDVDDDHAYPSDNSATGVGIGGSGSDLKKPANRSAFGFGFGFLHRPFSTSSSSIPPPRRTRQSSTYSTTSEKLMHLPDPSPFEGMCSCRGLINITSMLLILCGLILLILGYPIASSLRKDRLAAEAAAAEAASAANAAMSQVRFAMDSQQQGGVGIPGLVGPMSKTATSTVVKTAMRGMVDEDTPQEKRTTVAKDGGLWDLVFSDEFNLDGRSFAPGQDPHWEAVDLPASTAMKTLENYSSDQVTTKNGQLEITLQRDPAHPSPSGAKFQKRDGSSSSAWKYTSGMLQSWNKMCFQGGILEVAVSLPGSPTKAGLKPRVFVLGNLARYGYPASMAGVYPSSSSTSSSPQCNLTSTNSTVQRLNGCSAATNATLGHKSRGAPEMTLLETHYGVQMNSEAVEAQKHAIQALQQAPPRVLQRREYHRIKKRQQQQQQQQDGEGQGVDQTVVILQKQKLSGSRVTVNAAFGNGRVTGGDSNGNGAPRQSIAISSVKLASSPSSPSSPSSSSTTDRLKIASKAVVETSTPQWIQPIDSRFFSSSSVNTIQDKDEFIKVGLEYWPGALNTTSSAFTSGPGDEDAYIQFSLNSNRHPPLLSASHSLLHHQSSSSSPLTASPTREKDAWYKDAKTLPPTISIPQEPMSIVLSLGLLQEELLLDPELQFPAVMKVDYIRLYQPRQEEGNENREWLSCDPLDHPTAEYIRAHSRVYSDPDVGYTT